MTGNQTSTSKKARFSVADFVIVLLILACVVGIIMRYDIVKKLFSKTETYEGHIHFIAESITEGEAAVFTAGASFYTEDGLLFGELLTSDSASAVCYLENSAGELVTYESSELKDVTGSLLCKLVRSDNGYLLDGKTYIAAGSVFTLKSGSALVRITVIGIEIPTE